MADEANLAIEYVDIDLLVPYIRNSKLHPKEQIRQIANSIEEFGMSDPVGVWTNEDGELEIVEGHGRVLALDELGEKKVPIIRLDHMSDAERRAYSHVHNKTTLTSSFDEELLFADMEELDFDWEDFGFDPIEEEEEPVEVVEDELDEDVAERVKPGDIWLLGEHRLMCGDSTDKGQVAILMDGEEADCFLTDPPYNVSYVGKTADALTIENDTMEDKEFREFLTAAFSAADSVLKPGATIYVWHADSERYNFSGAYRDTGWGDIRETLVWVKNTMVLGRQDYQWRHEPCSYLWKPGASHNWYSDRKQTTVLEFDKPPRNADHPTMKPVALFAYQMGNSTRKGDIVLDLFGGSGTTIIAAEQLGRKGYCMELDDHYCSVIVNRYMNFVDSDEDVYCIRDGEKKHISEIEF